MKRKLNKILGLCLELSQYDGVDAFFNYAGHVEGVDVYVHINADYHDPKRESTCKNSVYLDGDEKHVHERLDHCIEELTHKLNNEKQKKILT